MVGAEVLGHHATLYANVEPGDLLIDDEAGELLVEPYSGHELLLGLVGLTILKKKFQY